MVGAVTTYHMLISAAKGDSDTFFDERMPLNKKKVPQASPMFMQEYACIPGTTMMDWMRMGGDDDNAMADMANSIGDGSNMMRHMNYDT